MNTQPEALRLARELEACPSIDYTVHAAELRRLHELALEQQGKIYALEMARSMEQKTAKLKQDALLEALKEARKIVRASSSRNLAKDWDQRTTAAIKAVEEGK
jgi:hypothetical protein